MSLNDGAEQALAEAHFASQIHSQIDLICAGLDNVRQVKGLRYQDSALRVRPDEKRLRILKRVFTIRIGGCERRGL